ncbi:pre-toxin TG domain-containing protein, partial [Agathobacter rectalis]
AGTMVEQEKAKLTFADFIGTSDGKADGNGLHMAYTNGSVEDFASIFAAQYEAMKASGALGEDNNLTQQEFLEQFYRQGEFTHDSSNPFLNFVSSVLDITIIKPVIEACTGEDLITGEDLTDMERGLKVVFAMVDLVTLGGAIAATKFSEMGLKEGLKAFGKTALIDFAGNTAACGVGALGETFDWPVPITMMLSLAAGITVSISGNKLLFKNADGIEIGAKTLSDAEVKKIGDVLDETTNSSFANKNLGEVLKQQGLTLEEFNKLRLTDVKDLTKEQIAQMKAIREAVPKIDANTYIQKTIPASDIDKYIGEDGWSTIGGYVARYDDISHIKGYDNVVESSRLDYVTGDGVRPYPEGGDTYGYIKFKTKRTNKIEIPYGKVFGGTNVDGPPCTLNGFTGARNGAIVPEWELSVRVKPNKGAELHKVINEKDTVVAIFDGKHFKEVKGK